MPVCVFHALNQAECNIQEWVEMYFKNCMQKKSQEMVEYKCGGMKTNVTSIGLFLHYTSLFVMFILSVHGKFKRRKLKRENRRSIHCVRGKELCIFHSLCSCSPAENMIALKEVTQAKRKNTVNRQAEAKPIPTFRASKANETYSYVRVLFISKCPQLWRMVCKSNGEHKSALVLPINGWCMTLILLHRPFWYAHYNSKLSWPNNWCELPSVKTHTRVREI